MVLSRKSDRRRKKEKRMVREEYQTRSRRQKNLHERLARGHRFLDSLAKEPNDACSESQDDVAE